MNRVRSWHSPRSPRRGDTASIVVTDSALLQRAIRGAGSQLALARALGVDGRTVRKWVAGEIPARGWTYTQVVEMQRLAGAVRTSTARQRAGSQAVRGSRV